MSSDTCITYLSGCSHRDMRSSFADSQVGKPSRAVMDGEDFRSIAANLVDEPVGALNELPHVGATKLRDDAAGLRELGQAFEGVYDPSGDDVRITRCVSGNVGVDLFEVADGPGVQMSLTATAPARAY